ncbi:MAG: energy transducer TonB [Vicinamibacterales bacterium]
MSQVLAGRSVADDAVGRMLAASLAGHVVLFALVLLVPASWMSVQRAAPESVMTVTLGGPPGPQNGGRVAEGGRTVQQVAPPEVRPVPVRPPVAAAPEMVEPVKAPPKKTPPKTPPPKVAPKVTAPAAKVTTGAQTQRGDTVTETRGQGFGGLSSGAGGVGAQLDVADFCCPQYLATMQSRIRDVWESRQASLGTTIVRFVVQRDGTMADVQVERSSGNATLDLIATRAIRLARQLPPLPAEYPNPTLTVHLTFEYQR